MTTYREENVAHVDTTFGGTAAGDGPVVGSSPGRVASSDGSQGRPRCCDAVAVGRRANLTLLREGGGSAARISSRTRPQDPGGGEAQIIASRDGATAWPMAQPTPTSQTVLKRPETVGVSAVLVEATPERSDRILRFE